MFERFFQGPKQPKPEIPTKEQLKEILRETEESLLERLKKFIPWNIEKVLTIIEAENDFETQLNEFLKQIPDTLRETIKTIIQEIRDRRRFNGTDEIIPPQE